MKFAVLRGNGLTKNIIFDTASPANRDDCFAPYALLRDKFAVSGIQLDTADESQEKLWYLNFIRTFSMAQRTLSAIC